MKKYPENDIEIVNGNLLEGSGIDNFMKYNRKGEYMGEFFPFGKILNPYMRTKRMVLSPLSIKVLKDLQFPTFFSFLKIWTIGFFSLKETIFSQLSSELASSIMRISMFLYVFPYVLMFFYVFLCFFHIFNVFYCFHIFSCFFIFFHVLFIVF